MLAKADEGQARNTYEDYIFHAHKYVCGFLCTDGYIINNMLAK